MSFLNNVQEHELRAAMREAEPAVLLMVYTQITKDETFLMRVRPHIRKVREFANDIPSELLEELHDRVVMALREYDPAAHESPGRGLLHKMMNVCVGEEVPEDYVQIALSDLGLEHPDIMHEKPSQDFAHRYPRNFKVAIVGAGLSGLCAAIYLRRAGIQFDIYEKNPGVGGTWFENRYPGCAVDTANHWYSYSFETKPDWSRYFVQQPELLEYWNHCADKYDVRRSISFDTRVVGLRYDAEARHWLISLEDKEGRCSEQVADAVVCAVGQLNVPSIPPIEGLDQFSGPAFHTARWDASVSLKGKQVALIGTGASGIQAGPSIADEVGHLTIYQRSAPWVNRRANYLRLTAPETVWALRHIPFYAPWYRVQLFWAYSDALYPALQRDPEWPESAPAIGPANEQIRQAMVDLLQEELGDRPDLLAKVMPDYPPLGKRPLFDNNWFSTLKRPHVSLVTDRIQHVTSHGILTEDGQERPADVIILATGFQASKMLYPMEIVGLNGQTIREEWGDDDPRAFLGITVPNYPNLFLMYGPNTNYAHGGSIAFNAECQSRYILACIRLLHEKRARSMEVAPHAFTAYNTLVDEKHAGLVWSHPRVKGWYKNQAGRVTTNSPFRLMEYWRLTHDANPDDYIFA